MFLSLKQCFFFFFTVNRIKQNKADEKKSCGSKGFEPCIKFLGLGCPGPIIASGGHSIAAAL